MSLSTESAVILSIAMNGLTWIVLVALAARREMRRRANLADLRRCSKLALAYLKKTPAEFEQERSLAASSPNPQAAGGSHAQR